MSFDGYVDKRDNEQKILRDCFAPGDATCAPATCCAATAPATTTSSTASATRSAGRARTSPRAEVAELLNGAPGVSETAVYGVAVPGTDGRAGMALVVLAHGRALRSGTLLRVRAQRRCPPTRARCSSASPPRWTSPARSSTPRRASRTKATIRRVSAIRSTSATTTRADLRAARRELKQRIDSGAAAVG